MEATDNKKPLVSVLIPSHGRPGFFTLAIESVVKQTYENIEIIVSDDSEDDAIERIVMDYSKMFDKIKYYHTPGIDMEGNWQQCWDNMSPESEYVNFLMDDDIFTLNKIERMMDVFMKYPTVTLVTSYRKIIDKDGNILPDRTFNMPSSDVDTFVNSESAARSIILNCANWIGEPTTVLFRKKDSDGFFRGWTGQEKYLINDYPLWLRLLEHGDMFYIAEPLSFFREHETNDTHNPVTHVRGCMSFAFIIQHAWNSKKYIKTIKDLKLSITAWFLLTVSVIKNYQLSGRKFREYDELLLVFKEMQRAYTSEEPGEIVFDI